jgi:hypothetical protein
MRRVFLVQSRSDLAQLKTWTRRYDAIQVHISGLSRAERSGLEETIAADYFACGCTPARWALLVMIAFLAVAFGRDLDSAGSPCIAELGNRWSFLHSRAQNSRIW